MSSDGDDQWNFLGLKFSIPGFFWVGKCGKNFFVYLWGFFGYFKQSEDYFVVVPMYPG